MRLSILLMIFISALQLILVRPNYIRSEETDESLFDMKDNDNNSGIISRRILIDNGHRIMYTGFTNGLHCNNEFDTNPCGPESICEDIDDGGIICTDANTFTCIGGCDENSTCIQNKNNLNYYCQCNKGYVRQEVWKYCEPIV